MQKRSIYIVRRLATDLCRHNVRITFRPVLFKRWVTTVHAHKFMPHFNANIELRLLQVRQATSGQLNRQALLCLTTRNLQYKPMVLTTAERTGLFVGWMTCIGERRDFPPTCRRKDRSKRNYCFACLICVGVKLGSVIFRVENRLRMFRGRRQRGCWWEYCDLKGRKG